MPTKRIIVCLDVRAARVVKGVRFEALRDVGDPADLAQRYEEQGADEIVFLDVSASAEERATLWQVVTQTAERLFIPLTVGGGIRSVDDVARALRAGADKVSINSAAVSDPALLGASAARFGQQCVVASIDAERVVEVDAAAVATGRARATYRVCTHGGQRATSIDAIEWAMACAAAGAGEILVTAIDRDGVRTGYDIELTRCVSDAVAVPVIASGGAGEAKHLAAAFDAGGADAALVAGIVHDGLTTVGALKEYLAACAIEVRR